MKYRELLYSFSLRQGRQEVEIQSGSQVRLLWYSSFLSLGWRAVAIMFYKLLIEEAVLNSRLQTTLGVFIFALPFRSYLGRTRDHTSNCRSPHLSVSSLFQTRIQAAFGTHSNKRSRPLLGDTSHRDNRQNLHVQSYVEFQGGKFSPCPTKRIRISVESRIQIQNNVWTLTLQ